MPDRINHIEALRHLDLEGALSGLDLTDAEGMAIRAAVDLWSLSQTPPLAGNAAIRAALKDWLTGIGLWAHVEPDRAGQNTNKNAAA
ncbi:hypothetical protein M8523_35490 [Hyphomicrobiales bacterium BP6-180914]|uniref:Uncharacterized protein n=2 Tax=Lichenifustis flavocetrariae TaxID=2949735 RepID=A0AA41ZC41_9HYPH|nr:hypothetical protein [Lichenifustis flavocetrariae]